MRRSIVGATAAQIAELDQLFPHAGQRQRSVLTQPQTEQRIHAPHDRRQIRIVRGYAPPDAADAVIDRRQIVGAYVDDSGGDGDNEWRELGLPLSGVAGVTIAAGATADFELKPNRLFQPGILSMDDALAVNLLMTALTIGGRNCLLSSGVFPMRVFSHLALHKPFRGWSASNAQPIVFTLKNIHASVAQVVYGVWWGLAQDS
jgi:hypothetical protein